MTEIELDGSFAGPNDILVDGEKIGVIWGTLEYFDYIRLDDEFQGQGYATEAIQLYVQEAKKNGATRIETTEVLSDTVENVFRELGFTKQGDCFVWDESKSLS